MLWVLISFLANMSFTHLGSYLNGVGTCEAKKSFWHFIAGFVAADMIDLF